ncbi:MAG TPA: YraN family protein [Bacteroidia bacterium]|nr:YraN family protein [Bacteroidia bacterium]
MWKPTCRISLFYDWDSFDFFANLFLASKDMTLNQLTGKWGEEEAIRHLRGKGMLILDVNWKFLHLEIDIIARDQKEIVIVEVKTRGTNAFGEPETFVNKTKQKKLIRAANLYLEQKKLSDEVRFDVIGIVKTNNIKTIMHIPGAFSPYGG